MFRNMLCRMSRGRRASGGTSSSVVLAFKSNFDPRILLTLPLGRLVASSSRARRRPVAISLPPSARVHVSPRPARDTRHTAHLPPLATRRSLFTSCFASPSLAAVVVDKALGRFLAEAVESGAPDVALAPVAEAVASLDVNGDGFITVDELLKRAAEEGVTLSREQAEEFIQVCDELSAGKGLCNVGVRTSALVCSSAD